MKENENKTAPEVPVQEQPKYKGTKEYRTKLENGTNLIVSIDLQLTNFAKEDFQEILSKFAMDSHSFYLHIAENIISNNREAKDLEKEKTLRELEEQFTKKDTPENRMKIINQINERQREIELTIANILAKEGFSVNEAIRALYNVKNNIMNTKFIIND